MVQARLCLEPYGIQEPIMVCWIASYKKFYILRHFLIFITLFSFVKNPLAPNISLKCPLLGLGTFKNIKNKTYLVMILEKYILN